MVFPNFEVLIRLCSLLSIGNKQHIKGFSNVTAWAKSLTFTKIWGMNILLLLIDPSGNLYLITNLSLLAIFKTCVLFSKYFEGIILSLYYFNLLLDQQEPHIRKRILYLLQWRHMNAIFGILSHL